MRLILLIVAISTIFSSIGRDKVYATAPREICNDTIYILLFEPFLLHEYENKLTGTKQTSQDCLRHIHLYNSSGYREMNLILKKIAYEVKISDRIKFIDRVSLKLSTFEKVRYVIINNLVIDNFLNLTYSSNFTHSEIDYFTYQILDRKLDKVYRDFEDPSKLIYSIEYYCKLRSKARYANAGDTEVENRINFYLENLYFRQKRSRSK